MNILDYFRAGKQKNSAKLAKERLQIIVAHERTMTRSPDYLPILQKEILEVVRKYVSNIEEDQIKVSMDKEGDCEILELNIALPDNSEAKDS